MTKTSVTPQHTCLRFETPFREPDGGARATTHGAVAVPKTGFFCYRNTGTYTNGFSLVAGNDYAGELFLCDIMPKHPNSTTPYDKTTVYVAGDDLRVHGPIKEGDKFTLFGSSLTFTLGQTIFLGTSAALTAEGDGTGTDRWGWKFVVEKAVTSGSYVDVRVLGIGTILITTS